MRPFLILATCLALAIPAGRFAANVHAKAEHDAACAIKLGSM